jgi:hypothetical protein
MPRDTYWRRYLAVGVLSLLKALAVRGNDERMRTELIDAGLFLALAALVRYVEDGSDTDDELPSVVSEAARRMRTRDGDLQLATLTEYLDERDLQDLYRERLSRVGSEPEPPTLRERIRLQ